MNVVEAMNRVLGHLESGDVCAAQQAVICIEARESVLPSGVFVRVLRAALEANDVLPAYATFCTLAYGKAQFAAMVREYRPADIALVA